LVSGILFAAALLSKYFAAFMLIPLLLFFVYSKPKKIKLFLSQITTFLLPALLSSLLWYQVVLGKNLFYMFQHSDFSDLNYNGVKLSYSFVGVFLWNYGLGAFFVLVTTFSLILLVTFRKELPKSFRFDLICLATILPIVILNMILGAGLNLKAPYNNAIKYDYLALPFFSLIAASFVGKCFSLISFTKSKVKLSKKLVLLVVLTGVFLLSATIFSSITSALQLSRSNYLIFKVTMDQAVGYSLFNYVPISQNILLINFQYLGLLILLSGLIWASRVQLGSFFSSMLRLKHRST